MTLNRIARWLTLGIAAGAAWIGFASPAQAIPVFARQTGHNCQACHISFPELTPYGREFKLNGYTFGEAQPIPFAFALMAEYTKPQDPTDHSTGGQTCTVIGASCSPGQLAQWSLFFGGRLTENLGLFAQYSSSAFPISQADGTMTGAQDNTELRYVHRFSTGASTTEDDSVVGFLMNNNLTMQDVWNSAPAWRFPWFPYNQVGFGPIASPAIDGEFGQRAVGVGAYAWIQKNWYAELSLYRKPWGPFSWLVNGAGNNSSAVTQPSDVIDGYAPYYRFAYSRDWGYNSMEVGVFGLKAKTFWDAQVQDTTPGNLAEYSDLGIDAQYQFNKSEPWVFGANASFTRERNSNAYMVNQGLRSNVDDSLNEFYVRGTAYYNRVYGVSLAYNQIKGSADPLLYPVTAGGSGSGSPDSSFWMLELNYVPVQNMRFSLYYQAYTKLNGGKANFDGVGNNAAGQNTLAGAIWWVF